jgi:uncharacterized protein
VSAAARHGQSWPEPIYLDASALVKLFVPESGSDTLDDALTGAEDVVISDLALTEMASALGRLVRERRMDSSEARRIQRAEESLADGCRRIELAPPVHRRAERLLLSSKDVPLRALDALHVAAALSADAATFVTYDPRLRRAASGHGLFVAPDDGVKP